MQKYIIDKPEIDFNFQYPNTNDHIFTELKNITKIDFNIETNELDKVKIIAGYVHNLFSHNGNNKPSSLNPIEIINEARQGKSFRCVEYSYLTTALLWAHNIRARIIGLKTEDMSIRESSAGHVVVEFWNTEFKKWIMIDVQEGVIPKSENILLSAFEFGEKIDKNLAINFITVINSRFSTIKDIGEYINWIRQYLYFFDTPIKNIFSEKLTEEDRLKEQKIMLIPIDIEPPKVFQKISPINAIYTHSVLDFYKK